MKLSLKRMILSPNSTIGSLTIDGVWFCRTLERPESGVPGAEAPFHIPTGTYGVKKQHSNRFDTDTLWLQDVPGRSNIEIHPGNFPKDTEGCILVGDSCGTDCVNNSRKTFAALMTKVGNNPLEITIS